MFKKSNGACYQEAPVLPPQSQSTPQKSHAQPQPVVTSPKVLSPEKLERLMEMRQQQSRSNAASNDGSKNSNFLRSALDRISNRSSKSKSKSRSSSVPLRTLINSEAELTIAKDERDEVYPTEIDDLRKGKG